VLYSYTVLTIHTILIHCTHCTLYSNTVPTTYTVLTIHCTHYTLYSLGTVSTIHCTHYTLYSLYTVLTIHCTHYTLYSLHTVLTIQCTHCTHYTLYSLCTVLTMHSLQVGGVLFALEEGATHWHQVLLSYCCRTALVLYALLLHYCTHTALLYSYCTHTALLHSYCTTVLIPYSHSTHWHQGLTWKSFFCAMVSSFMLNIFLLSPGLSGDAYSVMRIV
jgi:hypothetical protein